MSPILALHISGGTVGLLSGAAAMSFRKGSRRHRLAGNVFVISMLTMSASGVLMAFMKSQIGNIIGGTLTFYWVTTAWLTGRRKEAKPGLFDWGALLVVLALGISTIISGIEAANSPSGLKAGVPVGMYFFIGSVALLCAAGDARMIARGGLSGTQRLVRHLWRMSFAWFAASGSIFLARPHLFPAILRRTNILFVLGILPLLLMVFWLIRVRFARKQRYGKSEVSPAARRGGIEQPVTWAGIAKIAKI